MPETATSPTLRGFWTGLPRDGRWLLVSVFVGFLGRGAIIPFTTVYLYEVRDLDLEVVGLLMVGMGVAAFVGSVFAGPMIDRWGARRVLIADQVIAMAGSGLLIVATGPMVAGVALLFAGAAHGVGWPTSNAMAAAVVESETRQQFFAVNFALLNLGIGLGGVVGGLLVDVNRLSTFIVVLAIDVAFMLVPLAILLWPLRRTVTRFARPHDEGRSSYRDVLRGAGMRWITVLSFVAGVVSYGQLEVGLPIFARQEAGISTRALGMAFAANTATIVVVQFSVLTRMLGRRRTRALCAVAGIWAASWGLFGLTPLVAGTLSAAIGVAIFFVAFGVGETLMQPTLPAIVNDLAPPHLRGRYNTAQAAAFNAGVIVAPAISAALLERHLGTVFIAVLIAMCAAMAAASLALEKVLSPQANGVEGTPPR